MPTITAAELQQIMNLSDTELPHANAEGLIDFAIDALNVFGAGLSNLGGATPDKTLTVTSKQRGVIMLVTRLCYYGAYKDLQTTALGPMSTSLANLMQDPAFVQTVKTLAYQIRSFTFQVAEDTSGIEP